MNEAQMIQHLRAKPGQFIIFDVELRPIRLADSLFNGLGIVMQVQPNGQSLQRVIF